MSAHSADPELVALLDEQVLPVIDGVGFAFSSAGRTTDHDRLVDAVLYEAPPEPFTSSYPELASDYGDQPASCIDLWIHSDVEDGTLRASLDGTDVLRWCLEHDRAVLAERLGGGDRAGAVAALAEALARMLPPRPV